MQKSISRIIFFIAAVAVHLPGIGQDYQLIKSTISNSGTSHTNNQISISHTIGQTSLINSVYSGRIQLLQGFEHQLLTKGTVHITPNKLYAYPNPTTGPVFITRDNSDPENIRLVIYDLKGAIAKNFERYVNNERIELDLSSLPKGYYQISVESDKKTYGNCHILIK